ncbi:hypothetical protein BKA70DRAFT_1249413, partial [Coprinopsis sp. MPI-PUGE-AT-0042]
MSAVRKSGRVKSNGKTVSYADTEAVDEKQDLSESSVATGSKRKRRAKVSSAKPSKRRGNRGLLERVTDMPLDLLFEIFGQLHPLDLLSLARTTTSLRATLLDRSARSLWIASVKKHGVSEPAWVDLALGKTCQKCCRNVGNQTLVWEVMVRYCNRCLNEEFEVLDQSLTVLPAQVTACIPYTWVTDKEVASRMKKGLHTATLRAWEKEYCDLSLSNKATAQWISSKVQWMESRDELDSVGSKWEVDYAELQRAQQLQDIENNKSLIVQRIKALGCCLEPENLLKSKGFWLSAQIQTLLKKNITDRVWSNAEAAVKNLARDVSHEQLEEEHKEVLKVRRELILRTHAEYMLTLPVNATLLPAADLVVSTEMKDLFSSTPVSRRMKRADFAGIVEKLPPSTLLWTMSQRHLEQVLGEPTTDDAMNLAICTFLCGECERSLDLQEALAHPCATAYKRVALEFPKAFDLQSQAFFLHAQELPWNMNKSISFSRNLSDAAAQVLKVLKCDAKVTTAEELDRAFDILECKECLSFSSGRLMLEWKGAIEHCVEKEHLPEKTDKDVEDHVRKRMEEIAVKRRAAPPSNKDPGSRPELVCSYCRRRCYGRKARLHLLEQHGVSDPTDDDIAVLLSAKRHAPYRYWKFGK